MPKIGTLLSKRYQLRVTGDLKWLVEEFEIFCCLAKQMQYSNWLISVFLMKEENFHILFLLNAQHSVNNPVLQPIAHQALA